LTMYASSISATGPAAASNLNPDYVFTEADIKYTKITFSTSVLYFLITSITKLSILLLYHRLFSVSNWFKIQIYVGYGLVAAFWFSATMADVLNCIPLEWTWKNGHADPRYCINFNTFWMGTGIVESLIDLYILALPIAMVSTLKLERNRRWGVAGVFLLGGFVLFSGVAKVVLSYLPNSREPDFSRGALWTTVHMYTGILCANLPTSRPILNRVSQLTSASRTRLMSLSRGKRWYTLSGSNGSRRTDNGQTMAQSTWIGGSQGTIGTRPTNAKKGRDQYELPMYSVDSYKSSSSD